MITNHAKEITNRIYIAYGSDTGVLFGIPLNWRFSIESIVQCTIDFENEDMVEIKND